MPAENLISIKIKPEELSQVMEALQKVDNILKPYIIALTVAERKAYPKMSDKTYPFVEKVLDYSKTNSEFVPNFLNVPEMAIDFQAVMDLQSVFRVLEQIYQNVSDTMLLAGSEAYLAALTYYNTVKQGAKMNVPNAKAIHEDLRKRFEGQGRTKSSNEESTPE